MSVLGAQSGALLRTLQLSDADDLVVDEPAGHVIVMGGCMEPGTAVLLDARNGAVLHTTSLGSGSKGVAVDARTQRAFVASSVDNTVSVLDAATGRVLRTVPMGSSPTEVAVDVQTARAFVTNSGDNTVSVLDAHRGAVLRTIAVGADPKTLAVAAYSGRVFVVNAGDRTVSVLDTRTLTVRRTVAVGAVRPCLLHLRRYNTGGVTHYGLPRRVAKPGGRRVVSDKLAAILAELRRHLEALYGPRLVHMVLYGSQARGDAEPGSDIDVLVILKGSVDAYEEIKRTSEFVAELSLRHDEVVSCIFMDEDRFIHRNGPLLRNIRREGIVV